jgi:hypothetical protein
MTNFSVDGARDWGDVELPNVTLCHGGGPVGHMTA